jgi:hypothetical protein
MLGFEIFGAVVSTEYLATEVGDMMLPGFTANALMLNPEVKAIAPIYV